MRTEKEIKQNSKLMFNRDDRMRSLGIKWSGRIKLSNGHEGTFVAGDDEDGMERVSIQLYRRTPTWAEMCEVKDIFWSKEEMVVQIHPKRSQYINITEALHLWRPKDGDWGKLDVNKSK